jgi:hypothetical protein
MELTDEKLNEILASMGTEDASSIASPLESESIPRLRGGGDPAAPQIVSFTVPETYRDALAEVNLAGFSKKLKSRIREIEDAWKKNQPLGFVLPPYRQVSGSAELLGYARSLIRQNAVTDVQSDKSSSIHVNHTNSQKFSSSCMGLTIDVESVAKAAVGAFGI